MDTCEPCYRLEHGECECLVYVGNREWECCCGHQMTLLCNPCHNGVHKECIYMERAGADARVCCCGENPDEV